MQRQTILEHRYRRLLTCFPVQHRQIYEEEMIGVLLASAPDGRRRPSLSDIADLAGAGLRTRLGWALRLDRLDPNWRDAFAAYSIAAPALLLVYVAAHLYKALQVAAVLNVAGAAASFAAPHVDTVVLVTDIMMAAALLAVLATLSRQRGHSTALALLACALGLAAPIYFSVSFEGFSGGQFGLAVCFILEAVAIVVARDPRRGFLILGWNSLVVFFVIAALGMLATIGSPTGSLTSNVALKLAILAAAFALILIFASPAVKGMLGLMAIPGWALLGAAPLADVLFTAANSQPSNIAFLYLPTAAIAILVVLAMWQAGRPAGQSARAELA